MHLYELTDEYLKAFEALQVDEQGNMIGYEALEELAGALDEKLEAVACFVKDLRGEVEKFKAEEAALAARHKQLESRADWLGNYLRGQLEAVGREKFETPRCKVTFIKSSKVNVVDIDLLPEEYRRVKTTVEADRKALLPLLRAGEVIAGVELQESRNLQIK